MKVLILNGSPHNNGDTAYIINKLKEKLSVDTEFEEINAYNDEIKPCLDCRSCWKNKGCSISDKMDLVLKDDYEVLVIASPIYISYVTPPLFSIFTRLNFIWCNKYFINVSNDFKRKKGILILVGGGDGSPDNAINISMNTFKKLNADFDIERDYIYSLQTNSIPAKDDPNIDKLINNVIDHINN